MRPPKILMIRELPKGRNKPAGASEKIIEGGGIVTEIRTVDPTPSLTAILAVPVVFPAKASVVPLEDNDAVTVAVLLLLTV